MAASQLLSPLHICTERKQAPSFLPPPLPATPPRVSPQGGRGRHMPKQSPEEELAHGIQGLCRLVPRPLRVVRRQKGLLPGLLSSPAHQRISMEFLQKLGLRYSPTVHRPYAEEYFNFLGHFTKPQQVQEEIQELQQSTERAVPARWVCKCWGRGWMLSVLPLPWLQKLLQNGAFWLVLAKLSWTCHVLTAQILEIGAKSELESS
ncbi:Hypothetical predicted protein [Marmota monax]|uniref:Uncharacterized protein n=1 Tax=Marmota monax TaxID=9995 RepID=A0A5E4CLJ0_MARMO|nr:Hypothetical predicted protein [Marmota monax]